MRALIRLQPGRRYRTGQEGYVLLAVTVLTFVMILGSLAVFQAASSESKLADRQADITRAFYLADGALERARARLVDERNWRDGWRDVPLGDGTYSLAISDTTVPDHENVVKLTATGRVDDVVRRLEMVAELPPSGMGLAFLGYRHAFFFANTCITGKAHANGWAYFGLRDRYLVCGEYSSGFTLNPPPIYTDAAHFPGCTYYDVRPVRLNGVPQARIFDALGNDITSVVGDSLVGVVYGNGNYYSVWFSSPSRIRHYFDQETGVFRRAPGDQSVVVNFGNPALRPRPHGGWRELRNSRTMVYLRGDGNTTVNSTIITTRYRGHRERDRLNYRRWHGNYLYLYRMRMEPLNGIAFVSYGFLGWQGCTIGTADRPALAYVTGPLALTISDFSITGSLIDLGTHYAIGRSNLTYTSSLLDLIPSYLVNSWPEHVSGTLRVLSWRDLSTSLNQGG